LEIFSRQLGSLSIAQITTAPDGFGALAELERAWYAGKPYDLAFIDQMMPGMSGTDLARRIRDSKALSEIRLVLVSSAGNYGATKQALELVDAKIDKPVRQHELRDCLVRLYTGDAAESVVMSHRAGSGKAPQALTSSCVPLRILLAEDNKINQKYALALLEKRHHLTIAENGVQAVEAMRRGDFDVVLMDIQMPEMDGIGYSADPRPACAEMRRADRRHDRQRSGGRA
jgi:CheY-like chemotaxis protein